MAPITLLVIVRVNVAIQGVRIKRKYQHEIQHNHYDSMIVYDGCDYTTER